MTTADRLVAVFLPLQYFRLTKHYARAVILGWQPCHGQFRGYVGFDCLRRSPRYPSTVQMFYETNFDHVLH